MRRSALPRLLLAALVLTAAGAGLNMERSPPSPTAEPPIRLQLNVPAKRLYVYENGENTRTYRVSIGLPGHQTPAGSYRVASVIWNPWWHPPDSRWARGRKPEAPGPANPMGRVKLNFAPLLYIHGTNDPVVLGDPASHGCVRMLNEEVIELARLLQSHVTPNVAEEALDRLVAAPSLTRRYVLPQGIPFDVVYDVAAVHDGFLLLYPDVYRKGHDYREQVRSALREEGIELAEADWARLEPLLEKGRKTKVAMALTEVMGTAAAGQDGSHER